MPRSTPPPDALHPHPANTPMDGPLAGQTKIPFEAEAVFDALAREMAEIAEIRGLQLVFDLDPTVFRTWIGDPLALGQILSRLVANAIRFTDAGWIALKAWPGHPVRDDPPHGLHLSVTDTGIGMTPSMLDSVFEASAPSTATPRWPSPHPGPDLPACWQLARHMNGQLRASSRPGNGSCFTLTLPLQARPSAEAPPGDAFQGQVLVFEPFQIQRQVLRRQFEWLGWRVVEAVSAHDMLARLEHQDPRQPMLDLVVADAVRLASVAGAVQALLGRLALPPAALLRLQPAIDDIGHALEPMPGVRRTADLHRPVLLPQLQRVMAAALHGG